MGWIKTVEAVHKDAIKVLKTELERLTQENQELRATVERLTWENKQAEISVSHLEEALHVYHGGEHREPPVSGSGASLF